MRIIFFRGVILRLMIMVLLIATGLYFLYLMNRQSSSA
jgi:hypothetical protein